jgi:hypothetical protein
MSRVRNRVRWGTAAACMLLLLGSVPVVWGLATYVHLVRLRVELTDARSRVEAACRSRVELVSSLIQSADAFACVEPERLAALRGATERAVPGVQFGRILEDPRSYQDFRSKQNELTARLSEIWSAASVDSRAGALVIVEDFRSSLERSDETLTAGLEGLDRRIEAYRAATAGFSGSTVARIAGLGSPKPRS